MTAPNFHLESLPYQTDAVEAVIRVFEGTPRPPAYELAGNRCPLTWSQITANLEAIAQQNRISDERLNLTEPEQGQPLDVCVEMETGTGKTLVYLRTLYRLHAAYGWNKFIIVVPTVAIRAGVMGTLADFGAQLAQQNGLNHPIPAFEYDSSRLQDLKTFIDSPQPAIMVMNSQAFVGQGKVISNEENEAPLDGLTWLQALARCRPVVVMDEPQMGMDTPAARKAFGDMHPLAKLRYSATHNTDHARNCVYRLTPAQAYEQGLVKKIEVLTIDEQAADTADQKLQVLNATLEHAITATLGGAFQKKSEDSRQLDKFWLYVLIAGLCGIFGIGFARYSATAELIQQKAEISYIAFQLLINLASMSGPIWLSWVATLRLARTHAITEDYSYKAALAQAYQGYSTSVAE